MTFFVRLLDADDKKSALIEACANVRSGTPCVKVFQPSPEAFFQIPGTPFAYQASDEVRRAFKEIPSFETNGRAVKQGLATADDFRFVRVWWETLPSSTRWFGYAKGSVFSPFYSDVRTQVNWRGDGEEIRNNLNNSGGVRSNIWMLQETAQKFFLKPGLTWPLRGARISVQAVPKGCVFSVAGKMAFAETEELPAIYGIMNSKAYLQFLRTLSDAVRIQFEVGLIQRTPIPDIPSEQRDRLRALAFKGWSLKRKMDSGEETSHAFLLPSSLCNRLGEYDLPTIEADLVHIQSEIDAIAFDLYSFSTADRAAVQASQVLAREDDAEAGDDEASDEEDSDAPIDQMAGLLSWALGVAFGRFDWRLATGERAAPTEPEPFDPLPAKSPGMLPDDVEPFHAHAGILVDDTGHPHDLARLVEEVLARVGAPVPEDVRRWLQRDFFAFHLQRYSKSRRKAPIYWPIATTSSSYTLWIYYPSLTSQTLYTAINDFVEPKLHQVGADVTTLRNKGTARTRDDERQFESLQAFELELIELRDTLLKLAPTYKPYHDDGVQISAAPLWPLFRHKPWQKVLKDTWAKLEKGDYDWAHLTMNYWPERVREKCKTDKSLAIAHGLEDLYVEPEAAPKKTRGRKKTGGDE
ncbi:hypothetical protein ACM7QS_30915 [Pseudomonas aeruginosa]